MPADIQMTSINVITQPRVHVVSVPMFIAHPKYELPPHEYASENIIAMGGKVCYDSYGLDGRPVAQHVIGLLEQKHGSVLEHANIGLFFEGISRGCSHEIVRHRAGFSYSQRSTRYTAEDDAAMVLEPYYADIYERQRFSDEHVTDRESYLLGLALRSFESDLQVYRETVRDLGEMHESERLRIGAPLDGKSFRKWVRGKARQLLPHALETRMVMTGNLRAWRHFLVMRSSRHAEAEVRRLADAVWRTVRPYAPNAFADMVEASMDGYAELRVL